MPPLLRRSWYGLNQAFRRRIAHTGVTPDQYTALRILSEADGQGLTQRELTTCMSSDPNTVASLLERMQGSGWVDRQPHETDRRAYRIRILPEGLDRFQACRVIAEALQAEVLSALPQSERDDFLEKLDRVSQACKAAAERSPRSTRDHVKQP